MYLSGAVRRATRCVIDMAIDAKTGKKLFMVAQSYMPAQDIHILVNRNKPSVSPWYELDVSAQDILTPMAFHIN